MEIRDFRQKEWFWLDNEYLNGYARLLNPNATAVYISLCRHANNKSQSCFPSMRLIAEENNISTKTVERSTKLLEDWGIITIKKGRGTDGKQLNNVYTLTAKNTWRSKPTDSKSNGADRLEEGSPTDSNDACRQTDVLHNNTNITILTQQEETKPVCVADLLGLSRAIFLKKGKEFSESEVIEYTYRFQKDLEKIYKYPEKRVNSLMAKLSSTPEYSEWGTGLLLYKLAN